jgi:hypothetical protein
MANDPKSLGHMGHNADDEPKQRQAQPPEPGVSPAARGVNFSDVLTALALGVSPQAPRLPEQSMTAAQYFGGYQKGFTSRMGFRGTLSFQVLRQTAERSMLIAAVMSTRKHQAVRYARVAQRSKRGEVGFRVSHARAHEKDFQVPEGFGWLCRQAESLLSKPWRVYWDEGKVFRDVEPTAASFISKVTEDTLVLNRPCVELGLDSNKVPRAFGAIDGANIIPTFAALKYLTAINRDMPRDYAETWTSYKQTMQMIGDRYKVDLDERTEYIFMLQGRPTAGFRAGDLIVAPFLPSSNVLLAGYPKSMVEQAIWAILAEIMAMSANSRYFEFGSMAEVLVALKGQYQDKHIKDIEAILQGNVSGVPGMFRVPILALPGGKGDVDVIQVKQNHRDMLFDVYIQKLTNLTCAVFRMHPSEINEAPRAGDNSGSLNQASQQKQINMAQEQGLEALLEHYKAHIFDPLLERIDPNLRLEWDYGKQEAEQLAIVQQYATFAKVNEQRTMMGLDPISEEEGGELIDNPAIMAKQQLDAQKQQADQQQKMQEKQMAGQEKAQAKQQQAGQVQQARDQESDQEMAQRIASRQRQAQAQPQDGGGRTRQTA